jgi:hypothetical protein
MKKQEIIDATMPEKSVKDFIGTAQYDNEGQKIWGIDPKGGMQMIADLRGWGAIQNLFLNKDKSIDFEKAKNFQDEMGQFIVDAINEKIKKTSLNHCLKDELPTRSH